MNLNPAHYFIKRYHSPDLKPNELKRMLNLWFPFLMNRIQIISISENFHEMQVCLKHSFWNRNPNKSIWGGSITSALDPFFPVMMKQIILRKGISTEFYSKAVHVEFLQKVESHLYFHFKIDNIEVKEAKEKLEKNGKYENWYSADGVDNKGNVCVKGRVQVYLRKR
jgi:uncharacterized protein with von Willebrand factor type A (vWA) domain